MAASKISYGGLFVIAARDFVVPDDYLNIALKEYGGSVGITVSDGKTLSVTHVNEQGVSIEDFKELMEFHKGKELFLSLGKKIYSEDDAQPHVLIRGKENVPLLAVFLTGDFGKWGEGEDGSHTNEYYATQQYLMEKITRAYEANKEDMAETIRDLRSPITSADLRGQFGNEGTYVFVSHTGESVQIFNPKTSKQTEFKWGWTSNNLGYGEAPAAAKPEEPPKNRLFGKSKRAADAPAAVVPLVEDKKKEQELRQEFKQTIANTTVVPGKDTAIPAVVQRVQVPIPDELDVGQRQKYIRNRQKDAGVKNWKDLPQGWKVAKFITLPSKLPDTKDLKSLGTIVEQAASAPVVPPPATVEAKSEPAPAVKKAFGKKKDSIAAETSTIADSETMVADLVGTGEMMPIMALNSAKWLADDFVPETVKKVVDVNSEEVYTPDKIQAIEKTLPSFIEKAGLKHIDETIPWSFETLVNLGKKDPDARGPVALAKLAFDYRMAYIKMKIAAGQKIGSVPEVKAKMAAA